MVDVGCGNGGLVRGLVGLGARVTGVEISAAQLARAIAADDGRGAHYVVGQAQDLPLKTGCADAIVFMRSLHHVPIDLMPAALAEARRVLAPGGVLYVAEPLAEGEFFALTRLVEDETAVRAAAQDALAAAPGFDHLHTVEYSVRVCLDGAEGFRDRVVAVDPARAATFDARRADIEEAFARAGEPGSRPGERCLQSLMRADVLRSR